MILIITAEHKIPYEIDLLKQLFSAGLERLHLRKPNLDREGYRMMLNEIPIRHHAKIMLHEHHQLLDEFDLAGAHLQEASRLALGTRFERTVAAWKAAGFAVSSSFHDPLAIEHLKIKLDYVFLSPVFQSISKNGYAGKEFSVKHITEQKVIGLGGIDNATLDQAWNLGYQGVGLLGAIWNSPDPIQTFTDLQDLAS